ncbi:MAG: hypothetical protein WD206_07290 [Actinomycetota bacterium]
MGCLIVLFSFALPRFVLFVLWVFTDYLSRGFDSFIWPFLGFLFLPTTTVAWAVAENSFDDGVRSLAGVLLVILGGVLDLGVLGGGARSRRTRSAG